ncbi:pyridoxamine 5'-phosphate oxidase family protein [Trebonia sp.]|uniref:pyridoxamine 5'-phosphate oxidase family protein n=1 Tax=Trebonia sp. TaxID=2767075 RepID=UPI002623F2CE|nr:pyridoxamine 5'-phosphate oxidase family protein [Trebonia sp.]
MITWTEFARRQPALAAIGREQFYQHDIGLGFLATVRSDGGPRVHPVCPVISPAGLHVLILPGPKRADLRRDGRYSLHSETFAPPRADDGFAVSGRAREETDRAAWGLVRDQVAADFGEPWPNYDELTLFELSVQGCLLTLTEPAGLFPNGPTVWKALS